MSKTYLFGIWLLLIPGFGILAFSCSKDNDEKRESPGNHRDYSNPPVIIAVDSLNLRVYKIVSLPRSGTPPFTYSIDSLPFDNNPVKDNLRFGSHFVYIKDAAGHCSERFDFAVIPPTINLPPYFSVEMPIPDSITVW